MYQLSRKIASALMMLVMAFAVLGLNSCKDSPCQVAASHKARLEAASHDVKNLGIGDYFLEGLGLSKVENTMTALRSKAVAYRDHLSTCTNSNCEELAKTEVAELDKIIKTLDSDMETQKLFIEIGKLLGTLLVL